MRMALSLIVLASVSAFATAQTNTFPSSGNAGIGTTSPLNKLDVIGGPIYIGSGDTTANASLHITAALGCCGRLTQMSTASGGALNLMTGNNGTNWWSWGVDASNNWKFNPGTTWSGSGLAIAPNGAVGVGTASPGYELDVAGVVNAQQGVRFPDGNTQTYAFNPYNLNVYQLTSGGNGINLSIPTTGNAPFITWQTADSTNNLFSMRFYGGAGAAWSIGNGNANGFSALMTILTGGNVGIGATSPQYKLDVAGVVNAQQGVRFPDGTTQTVAFNPANCGADYAESVDVTGDRTKYEPGDLLVIDPDTPGKFLKSDRPYSTLVAGIYSTKPGFVGRLQPATEETKATEVPMAMVGRVPTKVSAENGPIQVGDLLVTSSTMGYAMKGADRTRMLGAVIGKALAPLDSGTGVIMVLVTLQ
jgi:hypothetical protein